MAKTFDVVYERSTLNYQFVRVKIILSYINAPLVPAPLSLLSVPYLTMLAIANVFRRMIRRSPLKVKASRPEASPPTFTYAELAGDLLLHTGTPGVPSIHL